MAVKKKTVAKEPKKKTTKKVEKLTEEAIDVLSLEQPAVQAEALKELAEENKLVEEVKEPAPVQEETVDSEKDNKNIIEDKKSEQKGKFKPGDIVFISKGAETDLEGIKLFPQYKNYAYTVEAYDEKSGVYTLRKLNFLIRLKEKDILAPEERGGSILTRVRF